jgi:hypothetical protein
LPPHDPIHIQQEAGKEWDLRPTQNSGIRTDTVGRVVNKHRNRASSSASKRRFTMAQVKTNATLALIVEDVPATRALEELRSPAGTHDEALRC